jgi:hypothetical protein
MVVDKTLSSEIMTQWIPILHSGRMQDLAVALTGTTGQCPLILCCIRAPNLDGANP